VTVSDTLDLLLGGGVLTALLTFVYQSRRAQKQDDERRLAEARVLLVRLIGLNPNDPSTPVHGGDPHDVARVGAEWSQAISNVRMQLENTALGIRSKKHRALAARILGAAEPPLGPWDDGAAAFLVGEIKAVLAPKIVAARRDPNALTTEE
jgi:hypothetical protein